MTSVSRRPEALAQSPSAIQVITNEEIRRSGATSIPEALRLGTQDAMLFYHAGMIDLANGDRAGATQKLQHALAINPHFSPLFAPLAQQALK